MIKKRSGLSNVRSNDLLDEQVEKLARQIHGVYCRYCVEVRGQPYWTNGNYDLLDDETREADRYMARFILENFKPI